VEGVARSGRDARRDVLAIVIGLAVLGLGMLAVRDGTVSDVEEAWFDAINDLPGWLYPVVWPLQQLGALVLGPVVAIVALILRRYRLAIAALLATILKLASERAVKAVVTRERPGTSIGGDIEMRGDVSPDGESFVSGHAVLVAALAGVITPYLPGRWKVVPWILVGAVMVGRVYVGAHNPLDVICGAALGIAIAGLINLVTRPGHRRATATDGSIGHIDGPEQPRPASGVDRSRVVIAVAASLGLIALPACSGGGEDPAAVPPLDDDVVTVGSFNFPESVAVAEVYSQALEEAGFRVDRAFGLGPREFVAPALAQGLLELVPEYAGTAAEFHSLGAAEPTDDVAATHGELERSIEGTPLVALTAAPAQNANTFVVTAETAARLGLSSISDLAAEAGELRFGGPPECPTRRLCLAGLEEVYGLRFDEFVPLDAGDRLTRQALLDDAIDVALLFTTDPAIAAEGLVELIDDRGLQPAENITPLLRVELVERWGDEIVSVIDAVSAELTTARVRELNRVANTEDADIAAVVAAWRSEVAQ
jgi:osmoprotectant transport system substrate-binding protein